VRLLDLFCGRWGWSKAFAKRGWECVGVDLVEPPEIPNGCTFKEADILDFWGTAPGWAHYNGNPWACTWSEQFDFIVASSPCEQFSKHGLKCFWPNPPYPELGIKLFNHARQLCEASGVPYVMENVRSAQEFVGRARHHCGPFYLWGNAVPTLMPQGIQKGLQLGNSGYAGKEQIEYRKKHSNPARDALSGSKKREDATAAVATIPPELANCVADYAERIIEQRRKSCGG